MTPTTDRKQREIEAREALVLEVAAGLLLERGYLGLNMDLIAEGTEYSKGTIYNHFSSKEEVLAALVAVDGAVRQQMFARAATFTGRARERMLAIGVAADLFIALHPAHVRAEQVVNAESIRKKVPEARRQACHAMEMGCMQVAGDVVRDAVAAGDLVLPEGVPPEAVVFGLWTLTFGAESVMHADKDVARVGLGDPQTALQLSQQALLDGWGWRPLLSEHDYEATRQRVLEEVFPDEARRAGRA